MNGARTLRAVGMAGKVAAGTQPAEQALQANTAGGLSARLRPQTNGPQLADFAANNNSRR